MARICLYSGICGHCLVPSSQRVVGETILLCLNGVDCDMPVRRVENYKEMDIRQM